MIDALAMAEVAAIIGILLMQVFFEDDEFRIKNLYFTLYRLEIGRMTALGKVVFNILGVFFLPASFVLTVLVATIKCTQRLLVKDKENDK